MHTQMLGNNFPEKSSENCNAHAQNMTLMYSGNDGKMADTTSPESDYFSIFAQGSDSSELS